MNATTTSGFVVSGMWNPEPEPAWRRLRRECIFHFRMARATFPELFRPERRTGCTTSPLPW